MVHFMVVPKCNTSRALCTQMFSTLNFDQFNGCVSDISHYCKMDQTDFFLPTHCEIDFNSLFFGANLNQNVKLLPKVP